MHAPSLYTYHQQNIEQIFQKSQEKNTQDDAFT